MCPRFLYGPIEWKQTLQGTYIWNVNSFWWINNRKFLSLWLDLKVNERMEIVPSKILDQYLTCKVSTDASGDADFLSI